MPADGDTTVSPTPGHPGRMTTNIPREISRPGGRRVAVHDLAPDPPAGPPLVLLCHAAPGAGTSDPDPKVTGSHGVRPLPLDRRGYGRSAPTGAACATVGSAAD